jgi:tetratricopeptide (TPR) repeat protein
MSERKFIVNRTLTTIICALFLFLSLPALVLAQDTYEARREKAFALFQQTKYTEAIPLFEKLAAENPQDREVIEILGILIVGNANNIKDPEAKKKERIRGRNMLLRAKELGANSALLLNTLEALPPDGSGGDFVFSNKKEAEKAIRDGEEAFMQGDMDKAIAAYQRALKADPYLYEAALYTGDAYKVKKEFDKAGEWYAKAIAIDPDRETGYRYWGTALFQQGKIKESGEKRMEAYIRAPYNRLAVNGFVEWGNAAGVRLGHPRIDIPSDVSSSGDGNTRITIDPSMLDDKKQDGSSAWMMYGLMRASWSTGKDGKLSESFSKAYPTEKKYRHSLAEEIFALKMVLSSLEEDIKKNKVKNLDPSLARLKRLNDDGLLEPYILLARADNGIAQDYYPYFQKNPDKVRRYVVEYVMTGGGK